MRKLIQTEELALLAASFTLSILVGYEWWMFILFLFVPDISMLAYLWGNKVGAVVYNIFHYKTLAVVIGITGYFISVPEMLFAGLVLLGHSSMDRIMGYGLKYYDNFKNTHLGWIGKN